MSRREREERRQKRIAAFRLVVRERVATISLDWIQVESGEAAVAGYERLMRELHTLKGEANLTGFAAAARVAHGLEELVQAVSTGRCPAVAIGDALLDGLDTLTELVDGDPEEGGELAGQVEAQVQSLLRGKSQDGGGGDAIARPVQLPESVPSKISVRSGDLSVRVAPEQLDRMRHVLGELLLSRVRVAATAGDLADVRKELSAESGVASRLSTMESRLRDDVTRMANLISAMEDLTRELRMVSIGRLFEEFPRGVRELARSLGREVRLDTSGGEVEADREVIELMREPLLHLVRNAVDHGVEPPDERELAGKRRTATISLSAELVGDTARVVVRDDGRGIDVDAVRGRALDLGLLDAPSARVLDDEQVLTYLFASGFSTRTSASEVSGRGVGLDVVKSTMTELGGAVSVSSERGVGTTFTLTAPITTSIISIVLFDVGEDRYALPASRVVSLIDRTTHQVVQSIDGPALQVGEELALLVPMGRVVESDRSVDSNRLLLVRAHQSIIALAGTSGHVEREAVIMPPGEAVDCSGLVVGGVSDDGHGIALVLDPVAIRDLAKKNVLAWRAAEGGAGAPQADRTVLVAEDSAIMRDVVAESLRSYGLRVLEACDGEEALEILGKTPEIDLLVTDLEMPKIDGFALIERMRATEGDRRIPAVVVSTRGSEADKMAAMKVGADAYVVKSEFSREGLWATVSRFV